ncbi:hypothetical protein [Mycoplasma parvum]|uniref:Uncharacterized protein n=1 Tax=Mycoplasma parvum str. Indiana TaxID=1403316 RepID=U5NFJ8_9MOLU|nr:hypothetical protein [Mycoplasma parvum]AGX88924.1 hypothetical protein PRV_00795 [Mycoplasma parvum str. Indiana]
MHGNQQGKNFDIWTNLSRGGIKERIKEVAKYFIVCYGAKVKIIDYGISNQYFGKNGQTGWEYIWPSLEKNQLKEEKVEWQGSEIQIKKEQQLLDKKCFSDDQKQELKNIQFEDWVDAKIKQTSFPKVKELFYESETGIEVQKKRTKGIIVTEIGNVRPHKGKIRILQVIKGDDYWYVDLWFKHEGYELAERLREEIKEQIGCEVVENDEQELMSTTNSCKGLIKIANTNYYSEDSNKKNNNNQGECLKTVSDSGIQLTGDCNYSEETGTIWESVKQELATKWLEVGQEIGVMWQGKRFKWRSF